jgi:hypothetical protein
MVLEYSPPANPYANYGITPVANAGTVASNTSMTVSLAAASGKLNYIEGFDLTGGDCTVATTKLITITGTANQLNYLYFQQPTSSTVAFQPPGLSVRFPEPIPASASNTAITVTVPALGAGSDSIALTVFGVQMTLAGGQS